MAHTLHTRRERGGRTSKAMWTIFTTKTFIYFICMSCVQWSVFVQLLNALFSIYLWIIRFHCFIPSLEQTWQASKYEQPQHNWQWQGNDGGGRNPFSSTKQMRIHNNFITEAQLSSEKCRASGAVCNNSFFCFVISCRFCSFRFVIYFYSCISACSLHSTLVYCYTQ